MKIKFFKARVMLDIQVDINREVDYTQKDVTEAEIIAELKKKYGPKAEIYLYTKREQIPITP
jgi:hypothetical protein